MSPVLIHPLARMNAAINAANTAGKTKCSSRIFHHDCGPITAKVLNWPTRPLVPMPAPAGLFSIWKTVVANGPRIAAVNVAGIQIRQLRTMLGIWIIEVPKPWLTSPPMPLSL
ncbi:hypothetical protein SDC9_169667 [bioreactor metagenome]|uniref:Uncharacterized protein n=1 Tax=bioreactor metagenome TaxID=1076179 RepID=A0A645GE49_9ZZZZ